MLKYGAVAVSIVSLSVLPLACGSSSGSSQVNGDGAGTTGSSAGSTNIIVGDGTGGGGTGLTGNLNGGTVALTPAQVMSITQSACTGWTTEGENLPAAIELVIDTSGSMDDPAPGGKNGASKWVVTRDALTAAIASLPASVSLGALYFPNQDTGSSTTARPVTACINTKTMVPMGVLGAAGSMLRTTIDASLTAIKPNSYTPTHDAYKYALVNGLEPYMTTANKFMLLITDGAPTMSLGCIGGNTGGRGGGVMDMPTDPIIAEIAAADAMMIRTFVIGSPGSEKSDTGTGMDMRPWLSAAARAGGTATPGCVDTGPNYCHLDMTQSTDFSAALTAGLASIAGQVVDPCTFTIPAPPAGMTIDPNLTNLIITSGSGASTLVLPDTMATCTEGWQFNGTDKVVLCPTTCAQVKGDTAAHVQLVFGCSTSQVVPVK